MSRPSRTRAHESFRREATFRAEPHALASAVLAAAAFEVTRRGFTWYVAHSPSYEIMYGALAAVPVFLLWIFVFWMIVLAGAAVTAALADARGER